MHDEELGSPLPQFRFYSRADDVIDLGNLVRLAEKDIWNAIEATGVKYQDWTACNEFDGKDVILGCEPLQVSLLKTGSFEAYMKQKQREGADLAHIEPTHIQPSDQVMQRLIEILKQPVTNSMNADVG